MTAGTASRGRSARVGGVPAAVAKAMERRAAWPPAGARLIAACRPASGGAAPHDERPGPCGWCGSAWVGGARGDQDRLPRRLARGWRGARGHGQGHGAVCNL